VTGPPSVVVVTDANVLINLIHTGRLLMLGKLPSLRFVVPENVVAEITDEVQAARLADALAAEVLARCALTDLAELTLFAELRGVLGAGEAACLAAAQERGWHVASDEGRRFRSEVLARLGEGRLLTTPAIYLRAIKAGLLTIAEADADKALLAARRFVMRFSSFADLLNPKGEA
jgi:predicted nucleic acid-binding protein